MILKRKVYIHSMGVCKRRPAYFGGVMVTVASFKKRLKDKRLARERGKRQRKNMCEDPEVGRSWGHY